MSVNQPLYSTAEREALQRAAQLDKAASADPTAKVPYPDTLFVRKDDAQAVKAKIDAENDRLRMGGGGGCDVAGYGPIPTPATAPSLTPSQLREVYREKVRQIERKREDLRSMIQDLDSRVALLTQTIDLLR